MKKAVLKENIETSLKQQKIRQLIGNLLIVTAPQVPIIANNRYNSTGYPGEIEMKRRTWYGGHIVSTVCFDQVNWVNKNPLFSRSATNALEEIVNLIGARMNKSYVNFTCNSQRESFFYGRIEYPVMCSLSDYASYHRNDIPHSLETHQQISNRVKLLCMRMFK